MNNNVILLAAAACLLAACSQHSAAPPQAAAQPAPVAPTPTILDDQMRALQKARDVQKTVDQQKRDADKQLTDQGG